MKHKFCRIGSSKHSRQCRRSAASCWIFSNTNKRPKHASVHNTSRCPVIHHQRKSFVRVSICSISVLEASKIWLTPCQRLAVNHLGKGKRYAYTGHRTVPAKTISSYTQAIGQHFFWHCVQHPIRLRCSNPAGRQSPRRSVLKLNVHQTRALLERHMAI